MTTVTASELFQYLESHQNIEIDRREILSFSFGTIRRNIRRIVVSLYDSDDEEALRLARELRAMLSEWLTVPAPFDKVIEESLVSTMGPPEAVQARWGKDILECYELCRNAAQKIQSEESPVRAQLRIVLMDIRARRQRFKIYCHRRSIDHFQTILAEEHQELLPAEIFLNTLKGYRETGPLDVLIKMGPLRVRGWGSVPDALVSSPRFSKLIQVVWAGCNDDADFGYDPAANAGMAGSDDAADVGMPKQNIYSQMNIKTAVTRYGNDPGAFNLTDNDLDDLRIFSTLEQTAEYRPATLVHVEDLHGIFYPPHSRVISFDCDPASQSPVMLRMPGDSLIEGMYVIVPVVDDVDLGGIHARHGHFSEVWKGRLKEHYSAAPDKLIARLRAAGLNLVNLSAAIKHWCSPPSTVIHAPQQVKHFEILINVLEVNHDVEVGTAHHMQPFWQIAWNEVRRSRGEAIQAGFQEQEIVEEQLLHVLSQLVPELRERASRSAGFNLAIPPQHGIRGTFNFLRIEEIETGFRVPNAYLRIIHDIRTVDQWRV